jgi:predicted enzyme related to lactoylglutathione lyase
VDTGDDDTTLQKNRLPQHFRPRRRCGVGLLFRESGARADLAQQQGGLKLPDCNAELVLHDGDRPLETDLVVDSVPEALARFISAGGRVLKGPFEIQIGLCAVVADPWDNVLVILDASKGTLRVDEKKRVIENPAT